MKEPNSVCWVLFCLFLLCFNFKTYWKHIHILSTFRYMYCLQENLFKIFMLNFNRDTNTYKILVCLQKATIVEIVDENSLKFILQTFFRNEPSVDHVTVSSAYYTLFSQQFLHFCMSNYPCVKLRRIGLGYQNLPTPLHSFWPSVKNSRTLHTLYKEGWPQIPRDKSRMNFSTYTFHLGWNWIITLYKLICIVNKDIHQTMLVWKQTTSSLVCMYL